MIRELRLKEVEEITGGRLLGADASFHAVSTDSRSLRAGELFVALTGPNFDGHDFVPTAAAQGAAGALVSRELPQTPLPQLRVSDTRRALGELGAFNRGLAGACVIGLTGSQGKTTVKQMLGEILSREGDTLVTQGNLNNELGVPLTLLRIGRQHRYAVIEMGANGPGEIAWTTQLVRPEIAHITNIAPTHLAGFGSLEGVAKAKGEIWSGLREGGSAVISLDDGYAAQWRRLLSGRRMITISAAGDSAADYRLSGLRSDAREGIQVRLDTPAGSRELRLQLLGAHNARNALAAAALAMTAGAGLDAVEAGLAAMRPVSGRLNSLPGKQGARVIDDSYNASPASFQAAIEVLAACAGRTCLVAGDMAELGEQTESAHQELGRLARERGIDHLLATGRHSRLAVTAFGDGAEHLETREALAERLLSLMAPDLTVLVKGSRSAGMDAVVKRVIENGG